MRIGASEAIFRLPGDEAKAMGLCDSVSNLVALVDAASGFDFSAFECALQELLRAVAAISMQAPFSPRDSDCEGTDRLKSLIADIDYIENVRREMALEMELSIR